MPTFEQGLTQGPVTTAEALALFDSLPPVDTAFMLGHWHGGDFPTGHDMEGLLQRYGWHGKSFLSVDEVHPLVFNGRRGRRFHADPLRMPIGMARHAPAPLHALAARLFPLVQPLFATRRSAARLRMVSHRGQVTAAMIYDRQPIQDVFRRVDDRTVLGLMDFKGMATPYFFYLRRE